MAGGGGWAREGQYTSSDHSRQWIENLKQARLLRGIDGVEEQAKKKKDGGVLTARVRGPEAWRLKQRSTMRSCNMTMLNM